MTPTGAVNDDTRANNDPAGTAAPRPAAADRPGEPPATGPGAGTGSRTPPRPARAARPIWTERMSLGTRILNWLNALAFLGLSAAGTWGVTWDADPEGTSVFLMGAAGYLFSVSMGLRPVIAAWPGFLLIRNTWSEYRIDWDQIDEVGADMRVVLRAGDRVVVAWAVQKMNATAFLGRTGRPERVAARIETTRHQLSSGRTRATSTADVHHRPAVPPWWVFATLVLINAVVALGAYV